jgi:1-phosphofructokinase
VAIEGRPGTEPEIHVHAGGQGVWIARMLATLGLHVCLCGPFGGESGAVLVGLIEREGIEVRAVRATSGNGAYVHDRRGGERHEVASVATPALNRHELDDLYNAALVEGLSSDVVVLSGPDDDRVLPANVYRRLASDVTTNGTQVVVDLSGPHLDEAAAGAATVVKVSHEDLVEDGKAASEDPAELLRAMSALAACGAATVVVSRADQPTLALVDGRVLEVRAPIFERVDHRGAGDSMTAGIAAALARDADVESALRLGAAAGALNVTRHGLATGEPRLIERLANRVTIRHFDGAARCES